MEAITDIMNWWNGMLLFNQNLIITGVVLVGVFFWIKTKKDWSN